MQFSHWGAAVLQTHYPGNAKSGERTMQISRKWQAATYRGLMMGRSTRADMIRVLGEPKWSELFDEDKSKPECWYHYDSGGEFPGEVVFNVDKSTGVILKMILHPKDLSLKEAIKRLGGSYVATRYEFCQGFDEEESAPLYENPSGQFRYIEYRKRGMALSIGNNDKVDFIVYLSEQIANSKCKKAGE